MKRKPELRQATLSRRDSLAPHDIRRRSEAAGSYLLALPEFLAARTVMFFVSFGSEIDTLPLVRRALAAGKRVAAPRARPDQRSLEPRQVRDPVQDLAPGAHGILEPTAGCQPIPPAEIDLVVVPAAAWGEDGHRLGYGGGYYDRFLPRAAGAVWVGLGMEVQVVPEVPHGDHDLPVDALVTEAGVRRFPGRRARAHRELGGEGDG